MSTRTQEIYVDLLAQQKKLQAQESSIKLELERIGNALRALDGGTTLVGVAVDPSKRSEPVTLSDAMRDLTGGGPGGFGSPGAEIKLGVPKPPAAKKRTPKRRQQKRART